MIVKMSQKDSPEDIEKAYNLFVDPIKGGFWVYNFKGL